MMQEAVKMKRANFVRPLLEYGVSLHDLFKYREVLDWYHGVRFNFIILSLQD